MHHTYFVPPTTYHWHVGRVRTLLLRVLEQLNGFVLDRFCSAWTDERNIIWLIAIWIKRRGTCLWHVARDLTNLLIPTERLIRLGPDRRRSTQTKDGNVFVSIFGCSLNDTWYVTSAGAMQLNKMDSRTQTGSPIETGKAAFDSC